MWEHWLPGVPGEAWRLHIIGPISILSWNDEGHLGIVVRRRVQFLHWPLGKVSMLLRTNPLPSSCKQPW